MSEIKYSLYEKFNDASLLNQLVDGNQSIHEINTDISNIVREMTLSEISGVDLFENSLSSLYKKNNDLYQTIAQINNNYSTYSNNLNQALPQLITTQAISQGIENNNIDNIVKQTKELEQDITNKRRMIEINNYYSNMNTYINIIIRNLLIILAIIIVSTILSKKEIIPSNVSIFITVICILAIIIYVVYSIYDINIRDKFNFNQYIIPFDEKADYLEHSGKTNFKDIKEVLEGEFLSGINDIRDIGTCIGNNCCEPGTIYDVSLHACTIQCASGEIYNKKTDSSGKLTGECIPDTQKNTTNDITSIDMPFNLNINDGMNSKFNIN